MCRFFVYISAYKREVQARYKTKFKMGETFINDSDTGELRSDFDILEQISIHVHRYSIIFDKSHNAFHRKDIKETDW